VRWLLEHDWISVDPSVKIKLPKEEHRLPAAYLTLAEVEGVINAIDLTTDTGIRDRSIFETFYSTAMRRMELVNLQLDDLDCDRGLIMIRQGKGRKDRVVPIGKRGISWLKKYLYESRPRLLKEPIETVYLSSLGNAFNPVTLAQIVRSYLTANGIKRRGACHMLRHTPPTPPSEPRFRCQPRIRKSQNHRHRQKINTSVDLNLSRRSSYRLEYTE